MSTKNSIIDFIKQTKKVKIACVGDILIDEYHHGETTRISPEFPSLVFRTSKEKPIVYPGGAVNVYLQLKHWKNADVRLVGLKEKDLDLGVNADYCVDLLTGFNPRKLRFYSNGHHLPLRWDKESSEYGEPEIESLRKKVYHSFVDLLKNFDPNVVIFSDYNKGLFTHELAKKMMDACRDRITIVDPKCVPIHCWAGCTVFKPNSKEALEMSSSWHDNWEDRLKSIQSVTESAVLVTRNGDGFVGLDDEFFSYISKIKTEVCGVVGAGDCFAAILALGLGYGFSLREAAEFAYEAGAEYVRHPFNRPITPYELHKRVDKIGAKSVIIGELIELKEQLGGTWGVANGCFDLFHQGHLSLLKYAKDHCDFLVIAINDDASTKRLKGSRRPIIPLDQRISMLTVCDYVDFVIPFTEDTPLNLIEKIVPQVIIKGSEYKGKEVIGEKISKVVFAPQLEGISTTRIITNV
jgi:D-beta-D-heptose 7-phosphate kinase / D-beta-D-heptose 1-phosphate adenosyltransferase